MVCVKLPLCFQNHYHGHPHHHRDILMDHHELHHYFCLSNLAVELIEAGGCVDWETTLAGKLLLVLLIVLLELVMILLNLLAILLVLWMIMPVLSLVMLVLMLLVGVANLSLRFLLSTMFALNPIVLD